MYTLTTYFERLLVNIKPPQERLDAAVELPVQVRDYLRQHEGFTTVYPHTRLAGSYAQGLCVGDVKDVDFLVRVLGDPEANDPEAKCVVQALKAALDGLPEALGYEGCAEAEVGVQRARRSVHVHLKGRDFHLDVVPCIAPDGFDAPIYVPDRGWNEWIVSHPLGFVDLLTELNKEHGEKVRPLGKLLKHFRNHQMKTRKPKSYWLCALLVHHVREGHLDTSRSLAELFRDLLKAIYHQYAGLLGYDDERTPNIPDPLVDVNLSWNWSRTHFETFMRRVKEGRDLATQALEASDRDTAIGLWQQVFGEDYFPSSVQDAATEQAAMAWPGKSFITGTGLVLPSNLAGRIVTPTQPTRFHGPAKE